MRGKSSAKTVICRVVMFKLLKFGDIAFENLLFFKKKKHLHDRVQIEKIDAHLYSVQIRSGLHN